MGILTHALVTPRYFDAYLHPLVCMFSRSLGLIFQHWHDALKENASSVRNIVPIISSLTALIVTPIVSLATRAGNGGDIRIWDAFRVGAADVDGNADTFHVIPTSLAGRLGISLALLGFAGFISGVLSARWQATFAAQLAIGGMLVVFLGGLLRVYTE